MRDRRSRIPPQPAKTGVNALKAPCGLQAVLLAHPTQNFAVTQVTPSIGACDIFLRGTRSPPPPSVVTEFTEVDDT
jgi:hypothetical protein